MPLEASRVGRGSISFGRVVVPLPKKSYNPIYQLKENHIGSAVSEIFQYKLTDNGHPVTFI